MKGIREATRKLVKLNRRYQREEESDVCRRVENLNISSESIADIAHRLKTKTSVSVAELQTLKNGLMDDPKNIEVVLNTHGALRGLVREITGHEVRKQCVAAGCCCNLGLGDARAGVTVAKAAGPYLVAALDTLRTELTVTCAWALGNLAGSGPKACFLLVSQGSISKLCDLLQSTNEEVKDAALYALLHFAYQLQDELGIDHLNSILEALSKSEMTIASTQLLFILSCHEDFKITQTFLQNILEHLPVSIETHLSNCVENKPCCQLVYLLRTLANVSVNDEVYRIYVNYFSNIAGFKRLLVEDGYVKDSMLWLLGNLFDYCSDNVFFSDLLK